MKSLSYTSLANIDLTSADLVEIHQTARHLNALDGITGLLVFNGRRFLQIIEGSINAIDDLVARLRIDHRHSALEIRDVRTIDRRAFPDWSMELVTVSALYLEAQPRIETALPEDMVPDMKSLVMKMAQSISSPVRMPD